MKVKLPYGFIESSNPGCSGTVNNVTAVIN